MLFTIGTSNRSLPEFVTELKVRGITHIIDVRSSPYSRLAWFNARQIERWSELQSIFYRQEGGVLGGRAEIASDDIRYQDALDRIVDAAMREPTAIFCAEGDPAQCHRTWDVAARLLVRDGVMAKGILRDGREEDVTDTLERVTPDKLDREVRRLIDPQRRTPLQNARSSTR